jgi:heat shock protein HslJ
MFLSCPPSRTVVALAFAAVVATGCRPEDRPEQEGSAGESAAAVSGPRLVEPRISMTEDELALPATFEGRAVAEASDGGRMTLTLRPDGRFLLREVRGEERHYDRGRWYLSYGGGRLVLIGGLEGARRLAVESPERLRMLEGAGQEVDPEAGRELLRADAVDPIEDRSPMQGMFAYMADAALFTDCRLDLRFPVAQESGYLALERAYLGAEHEPGEAVLVTVEGRLTQRPPMEGSGTRETVVVDSFLNIWPGEECAPPLALVALEDTYWKLVEVDGQAVEVPEGAREPHIVLRSDGARLTGYLGCNQVTGGYTLDGERLETRELASTMMACPEGSDVESAFLAVLESVTRYEIHGERLELFAEAAPVARLEARFMR